MSFNRHQSDCSEWLEWRSNEREQLACEDLRRLFFYFLTQSESVRCLDLLGIKNKKQNSSDKP